MVRIQPETHVHLWGTASYLLTRQETTREKPKKATGEERNLQCCNTRKRSQGKTEVPEHPTRALASPAPLTAAAGCSPRTRPGAAAARTGDGTPRHRDRGARRCRRSQPSSLRQDAFVLSSGRAQGALNCAQTLPMQAAFRGLPPLLPTGPGDTQRPGPAAPAGLPPCPRAQRSPPPPPPLRHRQPPTAAVLPSLPQPAAPAPRCRACPGREPGG